MKKARMLFLSLFLLGSAPFLGSCWEPILEPVNSVEEFRGVGQGNYKLECDLDLTGVKWIPLALNGIFDGQGHTIKGLSLQVQNSDFGLFATATGTIRNLVVENASVVAESGYENIGIVYGKGDASLSNVSVDGTISAPKAFNVGGIAGYVTGSNHTNLVSKVNVSGRESVGGIFGKYELSYHTVTQKSGTAVATGGRDTREHNLRTVKDSINYGAIVCDGDNAGGLIGATPSLYTGQSSYTDLSYKTTVYYPHYLDFSGCENYGTVTAKGDYVGGIAGGGQYVYRFSNCVNHEEASIVGRGFIGGISGRCQKASDCENKASVISNGSAINDGNEVARVGGIVGVAHDELKDLTNRGDVTSSSSGTGVGGIAGKVSPTKSINYENINNYGKVIGNGEMTAGVFGILYGYPSSVSDYSSTIRSANNYGQVTSTSDVVAGIIGENGTTDNYYGSGSVRFTITSCKNAADVLSSGSYVGGIVARSTAVTVVRMSNNQGLIKGSRFIGGIAGRTTAAIEMCENTGNIDNWLSNNATGATSGAAGGIAGYCTNIKNCTNRGAVSSWNNGIGGLAGVLYVSGGSVFSGNKNHGSVSGYCEVGGVVGYAYCAANSGLKDSYVECSDNSNDASVYASGTIAGGIIGCVNGSQGTDYFTVAKTRITIIGCVNSGTISSLNGYAGGILGYGNFVSMTDDQWKTNSNTGEISNKGESTNRLYGFSSQNG